MSVSKIYSSQTTLLDAQIIDIEVDLSKGLHSFSIVGLANKSVDESKDRVSAAIKNTGFTSPKQKNQKIVVSLAPADVKKEGPLFDLPIAIGYLLACGDIEVDTKNKLFIGELSLDGELRKIKGVLPITKHAKESGIKEIYLPFENAEEASYIEDITIYGVRTLKEVLEHINTKKQKEGEVVILNSHTLEPYIRKNKRKAVRAVDVNFSDIKGQESAKRGLEIAAAGGHNIVMYGPPGTGKTMLAKAFTHLLPELSSDEILEVTSIYSISGLLGDGLIEHPPFRSPHHTASYVSLVGGGANLKPGEITLAHRGVLFLDELPEFDAKVLETLRQPLEDRVVTVSRAKGSVQYPAHVVLVGTMNPCPCGFFGVKGKECICAPQHIEKYKRKLSGPIMDRIDMWVEVAKVDYDALTDTQGRGEDTHDIKKRVERAREKQKERTRAYNIRATTNAELSPKDIVSHIHLDEKVKDTLNMGAKQFDLSARGYHRIIRLARTIADLDDKEHIEEKHILEALQYRPKKYQTL